MTFVKNVWVAKKTMKWCNNCNKEHFTVGDYCGDCGGKLVTRWKYNCLDCEHKSDYQSKFCPFCGSPLFVEMQTETTIVDKTEESDENTMLL